MLQVIDARSYMPLPAHQLGGRVNNSLAQHAGDAAWI